MYSYVSSYIVNAHIIRINIAIKVYYFQSDKYRMVFYLFISHLILHLYITDFPRT